MLHPGGSDSSPTGQSGCGRTLLQQRLEHRVWATWHSELAGKDHDWSGGRIHVDRAHARSVQPDRLSIGVGVGSGTRTCIDPDSGGNATGFTCGTSSFTCGKQVGSVVKLIPAIIAATFENLSLAEVAELADAHV